ncbi:DKNYY domain-containing protein [Flavobacterium sp. '19STA2R22 D10 B1']|uniref:DKNYY domain-containing protein n=1 Tax=Flavobacterium aerium TaxID=3037261 RepID=UPI00278C1798|nr:DKNYY domain-containing protein [Flavobacterium sp. '19STA2R22 D10 B1']
MPKYPFYYIIFCLFSLTCCSQQNKNIITDPIIDPLLEVSLNECQYLDSPIYIINSNYVIYENCKIRKYINADINTFHLPKYDQSRLFALDKNGVYYNGELIPTDTTGFVIIGEGRNPKKREMLWKTKTKLFTNTTEIKGPDVATFNTIECSNGLYYKDKNYVYYYDTKIEGSDGTTVSASCDNTCYDKNYLYVDGKIAKFGGKPLKPINDVLSKTSTVVITRDQKRQSGIDALTLKPLSRKYSMDKNHVYYETSKTPIKPKDFSNVKVWDQVNRTYVTDGIMVYYGNDQPEPDFDTKSFGMLPHSDFCFDKNGVYEREYIEKTGKVINSKFPFKYTTAVTDKNTFITNNSRYIIYENHAYDPWDKELYENLSPEQIRLIKKDKLTLSKTEGNNESKIVFDYSLYKSEDKIYWKEKPTNADAKTFEQFGYYYFKDKNNLYSYSPNNGLLPMNGIDVKSVKDFNGLLMDKNYIYMGTNRIIKSENATLLAIFTGYRKGCGSDQVPGSNFYLFHNVDGYWLALISTTVKIRNLGTTLKPDWNKNNTNFELQ